MENLISLRIPSYVMMFEEGNMANISPTIKVDIIVMLCVIENILIGANCSLKEVVTYKSIFQEICDVFVWLYS
jgi:hypothetical protein